MKKIILIIIFLFPLYIQAEEVLPEKIIENFFSLTTERGASSAIDYLFSNNPQLYTKIDSLNQLKKSFTNINQLLGKFYGYETISNEKFYNSLQIIIIFAKYEKQPLRFLFVFYKPEHKWMTYRFEIDTQYPDNFIDSLFKK